MEFDPDVFIQIAGAALEAEDRFLLGAHAMRGEHGGLLRLPSERYYQSIIWRALCARYKAYVEEDYIDLTINDNNNVRAAAFEMKRYFSANGTSELPGIARDVAQLSKFNLATRGVILFSVNPLGDTEQNISFVQDNLPQLGEIRCRYTFKTLNLEQAEVEFWIGLWLV